MKAELEIVRVNVADIITTSNEEGGCGEGAYTNECDFDM